MYQDNRNEYGCPLFDQSGRAGIRDFDAIVARLAPELRAAFEAERAARRLELTRGPSTPNAEWREYQRAITLVRQLGLTQLHLQAGKDVLAEQIEQLRPWLVAWQLTPSRVGAATKAARRVQAIPAQVRRLRERVPIHGPGMLIARAATIQPLGRWLTLMDNLLERGRRWRYIGYTTRGWRAAAALHKHGRSFIPPA